MNNSLINILNKPELTKADIVTLLALAKEEDIAALRTRAHEVMVEHVGDAVYYRGLIELSNVCALNCYYCGIRAGNEKVERYTLTESDVIDAANWCADQGYGSIVLQAGERSDAAWVDFIELLIKRIKTETIRPELPQGVGITLSLGEQSRDTYARWRAAGAHRYLLRIESTNPALFASIHPRQQSLEERKQCLRWLADTGFQVGTGVMIGIPGQTLDMLADDILFFKTMDIDMIGMGPYLAHNDTPMSTWEQPLGKDELLMLAYKMIAVVRLVLKDVNIAATTALQAIAKDGRERGLTYGANVTMPNLTPTKVRANYQLYEGKPCMDEGRVECRGCLLGRIKSVGRHVAFNQWGDSKHYTKKN